MAFRLASHCAVTPPTVTSYFVSSFADARAGRSLRLSSRSQTW
jgi:hypothetical protein